MSTGITIRCINEDDGPYHVEVNGETIVTTSYDEDGSNGMRKIIDTVRELAETFGIPITEVFGEPPT